MFDQYDNRYGSLLAPDTKLHRQFFEEMVQLLGIKVYYRAPLPGKTYTNYTEIIGNYYDPIEVGVIFDEHPTQQTLKKMGWVSELQENASIIHVPYDLPAIQKGALFFIPSGLDNAPSKLFRVTKLTNSIVYPASISCEIVPEYLNTFKMEQHDHTHSNFNLLGEEDDCNQ